MGFSKDKYLLNDYPKYPTSNRKTSKKTGEEYCTNKSSQSMADFDLDIGSVTSFWKDCSFYGWLLFKRPINNLFSNNLKIYCYYI